MINWKIITEVGKYGVLMLVRLVSLGSLDSIVYVCIIVIFGFFVEVLFISYREFFFGGIDFYFVKD